jgi:BioD-like phosphotransacetylase family protein
VKPFLEKKGVKILGVFQRDSLLESFTVRQLNEVLHGRVLCCEEGLDDFVENFSIGAMDVDSALKYFRRTPNKAVITGAHRSDIQLAAMETSTKCIILTGGLYANSVVIGKAQSKGIPIISVDEDTFTTVDRIEAVMGKARILDRVKMDRVKELFEREFDVRRFLKFAK